MDDVNIERAEIPQTQHIEKLLKDATFDENRAILDGVAAVDLGEVGETGEVLLDRSLKDPEARERGRRILLDPIMRRITIDSVDTVGTKDNIVYTFPVEKRNGRISRRKERTTPFMVANIHSHSINDVPLSPEDIKVLFYPLEYPLSMTAVMAITTERKMAAFRGTKTPKWDKEKVDDLSRKWSEEVITKARARLKPGMSNEQIDGTYAVANQQFLRFLHRKYDIRFYSCPAEKNIAYEESA